jgi:hypothetical protein
VTAHIPGTKILRVGARSQAAPAADVGFLGRLESDFLPDRFGQVRENPFVAH